MSLTTKALGKAERMCKRPQSHCLRQQQTYLNTTSMGLSIPLRKKNPRGVSSGIKDNPTKEMATAKKPELILHQSP